MTTLLYFLHLKGVCACLGRCFGRAQAVRHRVVKWVEPSLISLFRVCRVLKQELNDLNVPSYAR